MLTQQPQPGKEAVVGLNSSLSNVLLLTFQTRLFSSPLKNVFLKIKLNINVLRSDLQRNRCNFHHMSPQRLVDFLFLNKYFH